jgi:hypothetical protein
MKAQRFDDGLLAIGGMASITLLVLVSSRDALDALLATSLAGGGPTSGNAAAA